MDKSWLLDDVIARHFGGGAVVWLLESAASSTVIYWPKLPLVASLEPPVHVTLYDVLSRQSLMRAFRTAPCSEPGELSEARKRLKSLRAYVCKEFRWDIGDSEPGPAVCEISAPTGGARYLDDDGEEEEGEYAPVIVEE
ncbi:MAG: hypothetical protein BJ554DRAFT_7860 [Olpidium bornovanus]|uniref:Uncharacterized protein n=1 Tax=Olpidium bornovanus TaxID=278681 RepID=A0A8H8DJ47_9FUNG|nr:MAG: hypothetical protein BJ554DRAFT_7860 [Olpidium bornovanus]